MAQTSSNIFAVQIRSNRTSANLPAWIPPPGYFADVPMLNNPANVQPAIYSASSAMDSPFVNWGGSAVLRDYSALGAQVYYAGGHEASPSHPNIQMSLICDFSTLMWSTRNLPATANAAQTFGPAGLAPDGTPYTPHTYLGLQEMPRAWGGGIRGSLVSFFWAGSSIDSKINFLDVSQQTNGYSQLSTVQPQNRDPEKIRFRANGPGGNYPITVTDVSRQGWWAATNGSVDYTLFVSKNGKITQYPALGGNNQNAAMVLCDSLNLVMVIDGGYQRLGAHRKLYIRDLSTGAVTHNTTVGTVPSLSYGYDGSPTPNYHRPDVMGLQWVAELGCVVGLDETTIPPSVVKLTPPISNAATIPWTWSSVAVQHWAAGNAGGQAELRSAQNGVWSKFRWVPSLKAFVYATRRDRKPQIVTVA